MSIPASNDPVRLGLVGAGRWGRIYIRTLAGRNDCRIARLASSNPESAALVPEGCVVSPHWRKLITAKDLDGLIVATPPTTHATIVLAAMRAGLPVLVEKPLTMDLAEAETLLAEARNLGALVRVDHIHLYSPAFRELLRQVALSGPIRAVRAQAGNAGPHRPDTPVLWDWGSHDIAMMLALAGPPVSAAATRLERREVEEGGIGEVLRLDLTYPGFAAEIVVGTLLEKCRRFEVECRDAVLIYDDVGPHKLTRDGKPVTVESLLPLSVAVGEFAAAIRSDERGLEQLELGTEVVRLLSALA